MVSTGENIEQTPQSPEKEVSTTNSPTKEEDEIQKLKARIPSEVIEADDNENITNGTASDHTNGTTMDTDEKKDNVEENVQVVQHEEDEEMAPELEPQASTSESNTRTNEDMDEIAGKADEPANGVLKCSKNGKTSEDDGIENGDNSTKSNHAVEFIELDDSDDTPSGEPPAKRSRTSSDDDVVVIASKDEVKKEVSDVKKEPELTTPQALLDKLEQYIVDAIESKKSVDRKVLDALLGAINVQVQREPLSVRKLILDKQLVLPNTISFPPSTVVDLLIEHDPDYPLSKVLHKMFGEERPKLSDVEKKERQQLKLHNSVPHMTKLLMDIGQDLVQEATYSDIVHARNLPETPKNLETYKQVAAQLKPVWETLKKKNDPYKLKQQTCQVCGFKSECRLVMAAHRSVTHFKNGKYQCAMCPEYDTNEQRLINHYLEAHRVIAVKEDKESKHPCFICDEDFNFKGLRDTHMKQCKKDYTRVRNIMAPKTDDALMINRWLWDRPPIDPTILQQQQAAQQQQIQLQKKQQQQQLAYAVRQQRQHQQQQQAAAVAAAAAAAQKSATLVQQQLMQQRMRQMQQALMASGSGNQRNLLENSLIAAMQQHLQRSRVPSLTTPAAASAAIYQKTLAQAQQAKNANALNAAVASARKNQGMHPTKMMPTAAPGAQPVQCEICDQTVADKEKYLVHLQVFHKQMLGKSVSDMTQGAPLACSRCRDRFWTYEGLERHLVMSHGLVTADLLSKAQRKEDGGRCKLCGKQYAFNMLQHLVADHQVKLCSAEIMYSCDVCSFKCTSYQTLESHLSTNHPKSGSSNAEKPAEKAPKDDCITLD